MGAGALAFLACANASAIHLNHRQLRHVLHFHGQFLSRMTLRLCALLAQELLSRFLGQSRKMTITHRDLAQLFQLSLRLGKRLGCARGPHGFGFHGRAEVLPPQIQNFTLREKNSCGTSCNNSGFPEASLRHPATSSVWAFARPDTPDCTGGIRKPTASVALADPPGLLEPAGKAPDPIHVPAVPFEHTASNRSRTRRSACPHPPMPPPVARTDATVRRSVLNATCNWAIWDETCTRTVGSSMCFTGLSRELPNMLKSGRQSLTCCRSPCSPQKNGRITEKQTGDIRARKENGNAENQLSFKQQRLRKDWRKPILNKSHYPR